MIRLTLQTAAYACLAGVLGVVTGLVMEAWRYDTWRREKGRRG